MSEVETFKGCPMFRCYAASRTLSRDGDKIIAFMCPYCQREHVHGWATDTDQRMPSHRVAHCHDDNSPFDRTGYFVLFDPDTVPMRRRRLTQDVIAGEAALSRPPKYTPSRRLAAG